MAKGNFIEYVVSDNPNKYPNNGEQGNYYYELYGVANGTALISFTIDGTSYQAEEGMTCLEWVNSDYNTGGYTCSGSGGAIFAEGNMHVKDATSNTSLLGRNIFEDGGVYVTASGVPGKE